METVLPCDMAEAIAASLADARAGRWIDPGLRHLTLMRNGEPRVLEYRVVPSMLPAPKRRRRRRAEAGAAHVACLTARDVTERLAQAARIDRLSRFDELTGAMHRGAFLERLRAGLAEGETGAVFALKLSRFKAVNSTLGREVGDAVLRDVVRRLEGCDPRLASVARLGSDVFAVHSATPTRQDEAAEIGGAPAAAVSAPYELEHATARLGVDVGIALIDGAGAEAALDHAEAALDTARSVGGDAVRTFDPASSARQEKARAIERALWSALDEEQLFVAYQPQVRLSDLRVTGAEALVRWRHRPWAWCRRATSSGSPRRAASSRTSAAGCCGARARMQAAGTTA